MFEVLWFIYGTLNDQNSAIFCFIISLLGLHFLSDFMNQNDDEAKAKSSDNKVLAIHCVKYSLYFAISIGPIYAIVNGALHFVTDYFTSRAAKKAFLEERRHDFFVIIGLDQLIHTVTLIVTFWVLYNVAT